MNRLSFLAVAFSGIACTSQRERAVDTSKSVVSASDSVVTIHGVGAVRVGMTVAEARSVTGSAPQTPPSASDPNACDYVAFNGLPDGVTAMVERGRVVRLEVNRGRVPTAEGVRIGDSEERVKSSYAGEVTVTPHKYTDGHYLTIRPAARSDSAYRIVFETDGRAVTRYRVGVVPAVEYVEGCS